MLLKKKRRQEAGGRGLPRGVRRLADTSPADPAANKDTVQVVVFAGQGQQVGLIVGRILDIVEEAVTVRSRTNRPGVLFSAVIQGRVTEFLDVPGLLLVADPDFFEPNERQPLRA